MDNSTSLLLLLLLLLIISVLATTRGSGPCCGAYGLHDLRHNAFRQNRHEHGRQRPRRICNIDVLGSTSLATILYVYMYIYCTSRTEPLPNPTLQHIVKIQTQCKKRAHVKSHSSRVKSCASCTGAHPDFLAFDQRGPAPAANIKQKQRNTNTWAHHGTARCSGAPGDCNPAHFKRWLWRET
jgi:hypothetical protein